MLTVLGSDDLLNRLYSKCFAGIINESALVRVWDKICGGSRKILAFVFFELIKALRENVLKCNNTQALKTLIEQVCSRITFTLYINFQSINFLLKFCMVLRLRIKMHPLLIRLSRIGKLINSTVK